MIYVIFEDFSDDVNKFVVCNNQTEVDKIKITISEMCSVLKKQYKLTCIHSESSCCMGTFSALVDFKNTLDIQIEEYENKEHVTDCELAELKQFKDISQMIHILLT